ncbi:MAG TPA: DUF3987 domain-containing protein [Candidatus Latescibacteria bacterium]|nr:DUF3987 domain-containing protein [Candidatus Latescibacterota bacterium]HOS65280.1 DUF3987 domain-containing protein [Candidatus Latescibacterota bacterium]HPK75015.1 DUF3987 domain-containing protein [Candidatus Latescibacterota bacterium]
MNTPRGIPGNRDKRALTCYWAYHNEDGNIVGYVARYGDADGKVVIPYFKRTGNRWAPGTLGTPTPPFGLPSLKRASLPRVVFVVEGEKCAAALHSLGFACVTSQGGCEAAHKSDWTPLGPFGNVCILPDNDAPGKHYCDEVVMELRQLPGNREITVCQLPGLPERGDVVDWFATRLTKPWDGYTPVPREPGDGLDDEFLAAIKENSHSAPLGDTTSISLVIDPESWDEPVPLGPVDLLEWPRDTFPEPIENMVKGIAAFTETPTALPALNVLAVLATCAQHHYRICVEQGYFEPLNIWVCCALPPGTRKSAALAPARDPLVEWETEQRERLTPKIKRLQSERKTNEAAVKHLRDRAVAKGIPDPKSIAEIAEAEAALPTIPVEPRLWTNDVTPEKLAMIMAEQGECMAILSDEGGIFDTIAGRYSKGVPNLDVFLQSHTGTAVRVHRAGREEIQLRSPLLTIGLCPQPEVVRSLSTTPEFCGRGLLQRFLFSLPKSNVGYRTLKSTPIPPHVERTYHRFVKALLDSPANDGDRTGNRSTIGLSEQSHALWKDFQARVEHDSRDGERFGYDLAKGWAAKLPGAVARIAGIIHCARHAEQTPEKHAVDEKDMEAAIRTGEYFARHTLAAFDLMQADPASDGARTIIRWIDRKSRTSFSQRDCHKENASHFPRVLELEKALEVLVKHGHIRLVPASSTPQSGRPRIWYEVNPKALRKEWRNLPV